ncbi:MAG TPA: hypothetical protein VHZ76_04780 [Gammaproteobacteria bacterium]|jgi:hypothetical protein|nr:hypothetical protein [Gammaproteobacteria bacterium]
MKLKLTIMLAYCICCLLNPLAFGYRCYKGDCGRNQSFNDTYPQYAQYNAQPSPQTGCARDEQDRCQCTDPGCKLLDTFHSSCLTTSRCCEAFGNIGAR